MKALAKEIAAGLAFIVIGVIVSLAVVFVQGAAASPDPDPSYVLRGMEPYYGQSCYYWYQFSGYHPCWHDDEVDVYTAVDFNYGGQTAGKEVRLYLSGYEYFEILEYTGTCKGVRAGIYWGHPVYGDYRGDIHYLHIDVLPDVVGRITSGPYLPLGHVAEHDNPGCPWTGPHLHQSARITAETPFYTNKLADPTEDDNWQHAILWEAGSADSDGDGFANANELYIGTDPFDDCPDGSWDDAWPPDVDNSGWVNIMDVSWFKPVYGSQVGDSRYDRRYDLDTNGWINIVDIGWLKPFYMKQCTN